MQNTTSENELLQASLAGSTEAFGTIVHRYQSLICGITYSATGDFGKSQELAQETFIRAWKGLSQLKDLDKFRVWLCVIARNLVKRSLKCRRGDIIEVAQPLESVSAVEALEPGPSQIAISREQEAIVWRALQGIPQKYREAMVLFYREQQSVKQVAAGLELSEDLAKQRLSRGRRLLKAEVATLVEDVLSRTGPKKAFAVAVIAALPALAPQAASAAITSMVAKGSAAAKFAEILSLIGGILAPLLAFLGTIFACRPILRNMSKRERKFAAISSLVQIGYLFVLTAFMVPLALWWKLYLSHSPWPILATFVLLLVPVIPFTVWSTRKEKQIQIEEGTYLKPELQILKLTDGQIYGAFGGAIVGSLLWLIRVSSATKDWTVLWLVLAGGILIFSVATKLCLKARQQGFRIAIGVFIAIGLLHLLTVNLRWDRWMAVLKYRHISLGWMNLIIGAVVTVLVLVALVHDLWWHRKMRRKELEALAD